MKPSTAPAGSVRFGPYEVDLRAGELRKNTRKVKLQEKPFQVLSTLLEQPGYVATREELRQKLWPADTFVDFDHGLNIAIAKLREALGDDADRPRFIETLPKRGYRLIVPVETVTDETSPQRLVESTIPPLARRVPRPGTALWVGVAAVVIVTVAAMALLKSKGLLFSGAASDAPAIRSLVVLPLKNLSNDPEQQYFADGMTEELITRLASLEGLRVISRTSAMKYKNTDKLLPQIASELRVDAVVEGSVLRSGGRVRITAQLVHGASDRHLWAESYERDERDVLKLQNEVTRDIARKISLKLSPAALARPRRARPVDPEAHRAYLLGRYRWHTRRGDELKKAIADFERAISTDPDYALAYAGLADVYLVLPFLTRTTQEEAYPKAKEAAERALALDPTLAEAHNSNAYVKMYLDWDFTGAEQGFRKAIELNPNYATAHQWYAELLAFEGRHEEASAEIRTALELDPLSAVMHHQAGQTYQLARRYDEAIQEYKNAIALDPWFTGPSGLFMSFAYRRKGMLEEAAEMMKLVFGRNPATAQLVAELADAAARGDTPGYLLKQRGLMGLFSRPAYYVGVTHAALGEDAQALQALNTAYARRDEAILYVKVDPEWDRLRSDPRFVAIARKVGLP